MKIPANMVASDVATQAELDAAIAAEVIARNIAITAGNVKIAGDLVQSVSSATGAVATGTTTIPLDDTIPQITEGDQYLSLAITPTNASNILEIQVEAYFASTVAGGNMIGALFQDASANALAACAQSFASGHVFGLSLTHRMVAGTTSSTTFRFRAGTSSAGTTTLNGSGGARLFGGVYASAIRIRELKA